MTGAAAGGCLSRYGCSLSILESAAIRSERNVDEDSNCDSVVGVAWGGRLRGTFSLPTTDGAAAEGTGLTKAATGKANLADGAREMRGGASRGFRARTRAHISLTARMEGRVIAVPLNDDDSVVGVTWRGRETGAFSLPTTDGAAEEGTGLTKAAADGESAIGVA